MIRLLRLVLVCLALWPTAAFAHKPSDSYLTISGEPAALQLRWDIALRDLDHAIGLDRDDDGLITWGELRKRHPEIERYSLARLAVRGDGRPCLPGPVEHRVDGHSDGAYAVLTAPLACPLPPARLTVGYDLFFDLDPQHRGLLSVLVGGAGSAFVLGPDQRQATIDLGGFGAVQVGAFFLDGVRHLLGGADHLLFLIVVLLPVVFGRAAEADAHRLRPALVETAQILTAFTGAHAPTLSAAVLGYLALPSRPVEILIALSIALTAIDNIRPFLGRRRWQVAGGFGLVHGLGFAAVLGPLSLPPAALALALLAFNLGIEAIQLVIALLLLPLGQLLPHRRRLLDRGMRAGGSAVALALAGVWIVDRSFDLGLLAY